MNSTQLLQHVERLSEAPDAIKHLRRFILDLAVRGKLVEQDPNDEPAAELLKGIQAEKMRLATDGKLKKSVLTLYNDGIQPPFDLPATWDWVYLGDVAQYGIADKVKSNREIEPETWVLDLEDIEKDTSRLIDHVLSSARPFRSTKTVFKLGDVLFGKLRPYLNKVVVADIDGVCSTEIVPIRGYCNMVPEYIKLVFMSPLTMRRVDRLMYGMKMPRLGTNDAISLEFPLAPFAEQRRIVAKVDELMILCDQLEAAKIEREQSRDRLVAASLHSLNPPADDEANTPEALREQARFIFNNLPRLTTRPEHIKQLRQTILNLAVRGKLVAQDPNDEPAAELLKRIQADKMQLVKEGKIAKEKNLPVIVETKVSFTVPVGWKWVRLGSICSKTGSGSTPQGGRESYVTSGVPFLRSQNVYDDGIKLDNVAYISVETHQRMKGTTIFPGDLLLNITGGSIGRCARVPDDFCSGNINQHVAIIRITLNQVNAFAHLTIISPYFQSEILHSQTGAGREGLPKNRMDKISIPLPPLAEQHRIVAKVDELMALCDQLEAQLTTTQTDSRRLLEALLNEALAPTMEEVA